MAKRLSISPAFSGRCVMMSEAVMTQAARAASVIICFVLNTKGSPQNTILQFPKFQRFNL